MLPETNIVHSFVCYDWRAPFTIVAAYRMLTDALDLIPIPPDIATVTYESEGKDYLVRNFNRMKIIDKKEWSSVGYLWKRDAKSLDYKIEMGVDLLQRCVNLHIDEGAVEDPEYLWNRVVRFLSERIGPTYAIGYSMPYFWGPHYFARAMGSSRYATADRTFYGPPDELRRRNYEFSETFFKRDRSILRTHIRDLFGFNLLCQSHLDYRIDGVPLSDWIVKTSTGRLAPYTEGCWLWTLSEEEIRRARPVLVAAKFSIVGQNPWKH